MIVYVKNVRCWVCRELISGKAVSKLIRDILGTGVYYAHPECYEKAQRKIARKWRMI